MTAADRLDALQHAEATRPVSDQPRHTKDQSAESDVSPQGREEYSGAQKMMRIPEFVQQQEELQRLITKINENIIGAERLNKKAVQLLDAHEQAEAISEGQARTAHIQRTIKQAASLLDQLEQDNKDLLPQKTKAAASYTLRLTKTASLRKSLSGSVKSFQAVQRRNQDLLRADLKRQFLLVHPQATEMQVKAFLEDEPGARQHLFADAVRSQAKRECELMEKRCKDMLALQQSIVELSQLYQQLDLLVDQQQLLLDSIESQMQSVEEDTEQGKEAMRESVDILKRRQKRKIIIIIVVIVVVLVLLVVILAKVAPLLLLLRGNQVKVVNNNPSTPKKKPK